MNEFDKIIGYDTIKNELIRICDMIKNPEIYEKLGAKLPGGIFLYGRPGLGKTLMAKCFIAESGLKACTVRRNRGGDGFTEEITETFRTAKENAPSIVFLDDMDKFANEDDGHCDAEEYVAVQAGIDDVRGCGVLVIATANEPRKLPFSLIRPGRFDCRIEVKRPSENDAVRIIGHFLSDKKISDDVNMTDLSKMISYSSCAELETIVNEAAAYAAFGRKDCIETEDLVKSVLRMQYDSPDNFSKTSEDDRKKTALHEAGHLVVCEALCPGSIGLASVRCTGRDSKGGFVHRCSSLPYPEDDITVSLAGKAAVEMYYAEPYAGGCFDDIQRAFDRIRQGISYEGSCGPGLVDVSGVNYEPSENTVSAIETATRAELERHLRRARKILIENRAFLEMTAEALAKKETLLFSDIQNLKKEAAICAA